MKQHDLSLNDQQIDTFKKNGYLVLPGLGLDGLDIMQQQARISLASPTEPLEYEAQLGYPGAPSSLIDKGGHTVRRLKSAYQRDKIWQDWARNPKLTRKIASLFGSTDICLTQAHHNCIMTKSPEFSSDTRWHQDIRYWSFNKPNLINAWLALGDEAKRNGGLVVIPGSHKMPFTPEQFDPDIFFREDLPQNRQLIQKEVVVQLSAGDVLLFHCNLLHRASRNFTDKVKFSVVFTYHPKNVQPLVGSRSARSKTIDLAL